METLGNIFKKYHHEHTKIYYLKMDIEGLNLLNCHSGYLMVL